MIGRTNTGGGGGGLNFQVVKNPQPTNPRENTFWINTDVSISNWIFSATKPGNPVHGMVWISTGTTSITPFNALKSNGIEVYPVSAKQYVSGAWKDVDVKVYQNGQWVSWWNGELYHYGNEYTAITGGWNVTALAGDSQLSAKAPTLQRLSDGLKVSLSGGAYGGMLNTAKHIDITRFKTVTYTVTDHVITDSYGQININIYKPDGTVAVSHRCYTDGTYTIDISNLSGVFGFCVHLACGTGSTTVVLRDVHLS